jgi:hypothetical protein
MVTQRAEGDDERSYGATPLYDDLPVTLNHMTAGRLKREFGIKTEATYAIVLDFGVDIQTDDVMRVVAGEYAVGLDLLVVEVTQDPRMGEGSKVAAANVTNDGP